MTGSPHDVAGARDLPDRDELDELEDPDQPDELGDAEDASLFDRDILDLYFLHAHAEGNWGAIRRGIEEHGLLMLQAERLQGFARSTADLETHVLPAAVAAGNWDGFLQYALTAVHLRGLAEALADEVVLGALARQGRLDFADSLAAQLAAPERRAWAQAVIGAATVGGERARRVRQLREELQGLPASDSAAEGAARARRLTCLSGIARHCGADLQDDWQELILRATEDPVERDRLWLEVAGACLDQSGDACHPGFRAALRAIGNRQTLLLGLPRLWQESGPDDLDAARVLADQLGDPEGRLLWSLILPQLGRRARSEKSREDALAAWRHAIQVCPPLPWSPGLIDAGRELFSCLGQDEVERIAASLEPASRAAFRVVHLEHHPGPNSAAAAIAAVRELNERAKQSWEAGLHWTLRALLAWPGDSAGRCGLTASVMRYLSDQRYAAPAGDLCRYLDLVAAVFPRELPRQIESVVWAPASGPETLVALSEQAEHPAVLEALGAQAEAYAAVAGPTEAAAFELRARLLIGLASRLAVLEKRLDPVDTVWARLLPEEQDELAAVTARALAADAQQELAERVAGRIQAGRLSWVTRLAIAPARGDAASFSPSSLYAAAASATAVEDERLALRALAQPTFDAEQPVDRAIMPIRSQERQQRALVDLTHHALACELSFYHRGQQDLLAPVQLLRSSLTGTGSDERLLALALELVDFAAPLPARRAVAEIHAALDAVLTLKEVPWPRRIEAVESLLAKLPRVVFGLLPSAGSSPDDSPWVRGRARALRGFLAMLVDLPARPAAAVDPEGVQTHWAEVPPMVAAALDRLPATSRGRWTGKLARPWQGLDRGAMEVLRLCTTTVARRVCAAQLLLAATSPEPRQLQALCYLLSSSHPSLLPELVGRLPRGAGRDRLCRRLVQNGWVAGAVAEEVLLAMADPLTHLRAAADRAPRPETAAAWLADLAKLVARGALDPAAPESWPLLRRLWASRTGDEQPRLANAVIAALRDAGWKAGEDALCVWLNALLPPRLGGEVEGWRARDARAREAVQRSLALPRPQRSS
jgi:hypothetical protein